MNNIYIWLLVGTIVGFCANLIDTPFSKNGFLTSVALGVVGAFLGGVIGQLSIFTASQNVLISPFLYIVVGSLISVMIPSRDNLL